ERAHRHGLAPGGKARRAAEGLARLLGQGRATALLADGSAGAQTGIEIVEDLGGFVGHVSQCTSLLRRCPRGSSTSRTCTSAPSRSRKSSVRWAPSSSAPTPL